MFLKSPPKYPKLPLDSEISTVVESSPSSSAVKEDVFAVKRPSKPSQKGFWNSYAPLSKIQNLDEFLEPSIGNLIEVLCLLEGANPKDLSFL